MGNYALPHPPDPGDDAPKPGRGRPPKERRRGGAMKETELRKHGTCSLCGEKILNGGFPVFWRVTVEQFGVDLAACRRQDGLTAMLGGNAMLASVMGADEDLARRVCEPDVLTLCLPCVANDDRPIAVMIEGLADQVKAVGG